MESLSAAQILDVLAEQLDSMREFFGPTFEQVETHWCVADARLTAFRHPQMWAVAFEIVGYSRGDEFENRLFLCGSHLAEIDPVSGDLSRKVLTAPDAWNTRFDEGIWGVSAQKFAVRWAGKRWDFAPQPEEWERHRILLSRGEWAGEQIGYETMLRFLSEEWNHPFFLSDDALRALLDEKSLQSQWKYARENDRSLFQFSEDDWVEEWDEPPIPSLVLEKVLQTRGWRHPKVGVGDFQSGEWEVSPAQAFGVLSEILAGADVSLWETQDAALFNSDWRLYSESAGVLEKQAEENLKAERERLRAELLAMPVLERLPNILALREGVQQTLAQSKGGYGLAFVSIVTGNDDNAEGFGVAVSADILPILEQLERESQHEQQKE